MPPSGLGKGQKVMREEIKFVAVNLSSPRAGGSLLSLTWQQGLTNRPVATQQCGQPGTALPVHCAHSPTSSPHSHHSSHGGLRQPHAEPDAEWLKLSLQSHL